MTPVDWPPCVPDARRPCVMSRRRRTPDSIKASIWAFTFSTPASATATGALAARGAPTRLEQHGHAIDGCEGVGHAPKVRLRKVRDVH